MANVTFKKLEPVQQYYLQRQTVFDYVEKHLKHSGAEQSSAQNYIVEYQELVKLINKLESYLTSIVQYVLTDINNWYEELYYLRYDFSSYLDTLKDDAVIKLNVSDDFIGKLFFNLTADNYIQLYYDTIKVPLIEPIELATDVSSCVTTQYNAMLQAVRFNATLNMAKQLEELLQTVSEKK